MTTDESTPLNLDPVLIPGMIIPVQTDGAVGGVNYNLLHVNEGGLLVQVQPYLNMESGDWVEVFWGDPSEPVAGELVLAEHVGEKFGLFIPPDRIAEGISDVWARVTRSGGGNGGESVPIGILVRSVFPGGTDPEPDLPGHQNLPAPEPELPPSGIIDEEAAKNGVKVTINSYPNMREFDRITFSWGGEFLQHDVTQAEVDAGSLEILVTEATILAAGDNDGLVLVYRVRDEVHNVSSDWSLRTLIEVEVGQGLFHAPAIENPDPAADPYDVIDLDLLGDDDLLVVVYAVPDGELLIGDVVALTWTGTTAQGETITVEPPEQTVVRLPVGLKFPIPNADVRPLGSGRAAAVYRVTRDELPVGVSRRALATFLGEEQRLPKPTVSDAVGGVLDPTLAETTIIVPGEALEGGDLLVVTWLGTRANGTPLLEEFPRQISGGNAGKPVIIPITGDKLIAPLNGGTVAVYYRLIKSSGLELDSEREHLSVGQAQEELPAPFTRPAAEDGMLDPEDLPAQLQIVVPPWPGMQGGQTLRLLWRASSGPHFDDSMPISVPIEGQEVVFFMDRERVEENLAAQIDITYQVESPGEPTRTSAPCTFTLGADEGLLPAPLIVEAEGDQLDPDDALHGATVRIDAAAQLAFGDTVTVKIDSSVEGGSVEITYPVSANYATRPFDVIVPYERLNASDGGHIDVQYEVTRSAGGPVETSKRVRYAVAAELGAGPLRIMGARFNPTTQLGASSPRLLSSLHDLTLAPVRAEWRYEDSQTWTARTHWIDDKPALKLYVRNRSETWLCTPANIVGENAMLALRDEVQGEDGVEVDMVAWGPAEYGGELEPPVKRLKDVVEVTATSGAFAARLRSGRVVCWGHEDTGGAPGITLEGFDLVACNSAAFVGRKSNGDLHSWGRADSGVPVPDEVLKHKDYVQLCGTAGALAGRRASGHVVVWGDPEEGGILLPGQAEIDDIVDVRSCFTGFIALRQRDSARSVIAWGEYVGEIPEEITRLTNVRNLGAGAALECCILLETGEVKSWVSELPVDIASLKNVVEISATSDAFCTRLSNGKVAAWGFKEVGGELSEEVAGKSNIVQVTASRGAFAALCSDGKVVAWGGEEYGGDTSAVAAKLVNVRAVYAGHSAFAALTRDGDVVTWGNQANGGDSSAVQGQLRGRVTARRLLTSEEAKAVAGGKPPGATRA